MIVGLKKRRKSKEYYELGVVDCIFVWERTNYCPKKGDKDLLAVTETMGKIRVSKSPTEIKGIRVKTFNPQTRTIYGGVYSDTYYFTKNIHLLEKICDEDEPAACKQWDCPHRFRCFTSSVRVRS